MSLLRRGGRIPTSDETRSWPAPGWSSLLAGGVTNSGEQVTLESALRSAAFSACRRVLVTEVAQLPVHTYTKRGGGRRRIDNPPIVESPSAALKRRAWVSQVMDSLVRGGNAYLRVSEIDGLAISHVETLPVDAVRWAKVDGVLRPQIDGVTQELWPRGDLIHIPASAFIKAGSPVADSPVDLASESIGAGLAAERYSARWFGAGGHPSTVIYSEDPDLDRGKAQAIKDAYLAATKNRDPAVLGAGLKREPVQEKVDDAALNQMRFAVEQACRFTGVPPSMVYATISGQNLTYANITDSDLQLLKHSLGIWLGDVEDHWSGWLAAQQYVRFNVDALLRVTPAERHEIYERRLKSKTMAINEVRVLEDEEPFDDPAYDLPGIPGGAEPDGSPPDDD